MRVEELGRPQLWKHKKTKKLYRIVGSCIDKERDEYCVLYRFWCDFDERLGVRAQPGLYSRPWKDFKEKFTEYVYADLKVVPTTEQLLKDLKNNAG